MSYVGNPGPDQSFALASGQTVTGYQVMHIHADPANVDDLEVEVDSGSDGSFPVGVAQVDDGVTLNSQETITVRTYGVTKAIAADAFSPGARLAPTTNGRVTDTDPSTTRWFVGIALTQATALGDEVLMLLKQEMNEA